MARERTTHKITNSTHTYIYVVQSRIKPATPCMKKPHELHRGKKQCSTQMNNDRIGELMDGMEWNGID